MSLVTHVDVTQTDIPNMLVPLDGKTPLDSKKLLQCMNSFHSEMKAELERLYQIQMAKQRDDILKTIAILIQSNYPNLNENSEQEDHINSIVDKITKGLMDKPNRKGRPKRKNNPWYHVLV